MYFYINDRRYFFIIILISFYENPPFQLTGAVSNWIDSFNKF